MVVTALAGAACDPDQEPEKQGEIFAPLQDVAFLASDGTAIYATGAREIVKLSIADGTRTDLAILGGEDVRGKDTLRGGSAMAVDDTHVYFASQTTGSVGRVAKTGGTPEPVLTTTTYPNFFPKSLAIQKDTVFVGAGYREPEGELWALGKDGKGGSQVGEKRSIPSRIVTDESGVYWVDLSGAVRKLAKVAPAGGGSTDTYEVKDLLADPNQKVREDSLAQDATALYVIVTQPQSLDGRVVAIDKASGALTDVSTAASGVYGQLYADTSEPDGVTRLYWTAHWSYGEQIVRARVGEAPTTMPESVARTKHQTGAFTVASDSVFWVDLEDKAVRRIPKH